MTGHPARDWHALPAREVLRELDARAHGLAPEEAARYFPPLA